jgi:gamma-glutamyl-gamma-aminobutyrate hydrolase PuuD
VARPVVGVTAYVEKARWGVWDQRAVLIPHDYVRMLEQAGARPLVVPPSTDGVEETLDALDGILFSGGADLDPSLYGAEAHDETDDPRRDRDAGELALLVAALERDVPTLAVCRGSQLLNVARGGDLRQHLPEEVGHERHKQLPGTFSDHGVEVKEGTRLAAVIGGRAPVKSHHHQGFGRVGEGLVETAWAEDGSLEGVEDPTRRFAVGVLWHPEAGEDTALFAALVEEARRYRAARQSFAEPDSQRSSS